MRTAFAEVATRSLASDALLRRYRLRRYKAVPVHVPEVTVDLRRDTAALQESAVV